MAFDFPTAPTDGQVFTPPGGPTYVFSAATPGWLQQAAAAAAGGTIIADAPPAAPPTPPVVPAGQLTPGQLWWESDSGQLYIWYNDGTSSQWVQAVPSGGGGGQTLTFGVGLTLTGTDVALDPATAAVIGGLVEAPADSLYYARRNGVWAASPSAIVKRTVVTANNPAFTFDPATKFAFVEVLGGGAGGCNVSTSILGYAAASGGGGAGGYSQKYFSTTGIASAAILIGAGGGANAAGGTSSWTDTVNVLTANGGAIGTLGTQSMVGTAANGGAGGNGSGGNINVRGQAGESAFALGTTALGGPTANVGLAKGGMGGSTQYGTAGTGGIVANSVAGADGISPGSPGVGYGSGGGGAAALNTAGVLNGGTGAPGIVIVTEYR